MAVYKVAQDVEADDKLLGPFSFRQFIYLIVVAIAGALAYGLSRVFIPLAIIPLPIMIFFGALALPLRKDQPMEIYLAALLSYYLKPRKRFWTPDGIESLVEITVPKTIEVRRAKDITESEAERRLSYLADIADTEGWAVRHAAEPVSGTAMITDAYFEAQQAPDMLDNSGGVAQSFDTMINQSTERRRQEAVARMQQAMSQPQTPVQTTVVPPVADPYANLGQIAPAAQQPTPQAASAYYNPYPTSIHQSVIQPLQADEQLANALVTPAPNQAPSAPVVPAVTQPVVTPQPEIPQNPPVNPSEKPLSPDIINLANNADLSIETIQREANRIQKKSEEVDEGEVFIALH
jgi:hypothetical protein